MPHQYWYHFHAHMSATLKADAHRIRQAHPERYGSKRVERTEMVDGQAVTKKVLVERSAAPMSGRERHALATEKL